MSIQIRATARWALVLNLAATVALLQAHRTAEAADHIRFDRLLVG